MQRRPKKRRAKNVVLSPPAATRPTADAFDDDDHSDYYECPCCHGSGRLRANTVPDWMSMEMNAQSLYDMVENIGVDERAQMQASLLLQRNGVQGVYDLHNILTHMFSKHIYNKSAFLASSCIKAMRSSW